MIETQAHRTLVKSPPELWAELSDPAALARHLARVGGDDIRITRIEPEKTVAWEGERARGTVELEPSGWGTKVTITLESEPEGKAQDVAAPAEDVAAPAADAAPRQDVAAPAADAAVTEPDPGPLAIESPPDPVPEPVPDPEPRAKPEPLTEREPLTEPEPLTAPEPTAVAAVVTPMPRVGLFRRLVERRRARLGHGTDLHPVSDEVDAEAPAAPAEPVAIEPPAPPELEPQAETQPEPQAEAERSTGAEPAAEPEAQPEPEARPEQSAPAAASAPADELLVGVLDSLGSAHHRPFSRS